MIVENQYLKDYCIDLEDKDRILVALDSMEVEYIPIWQKNFCAERVGPRVIVNPQAFSGNRCCKNGTQNALASLMAHEAGGNEIRTSTISERFFVGV
jgi:hypothetical protein